MLTRLKVSGFKNLNNVDVSFGPFTCIAGANGVGKSNLLDAITLLGALADRTLLDAALSVRDQGAKTGDVRGLFHHSGNEYADEMSFEAEMIIAPSGYDDLGQSAEATSTLVRYLVRLRYRRDENARAFGPLELIEEDLRHIAKGEAIRHLLFSNSEEWRDAVVVNKRRAPRFISTENEGVDRRIKLHQDGGSSGRPQRFIAENLPRTVLSATNSAESPTATLVKKEMQSWRLLQLEPSSLREPDSFTSPTNLTTKGAHLPATLYRLAHSPKGGLRDSARVYSEVSNRVAQLIDDVRSVDVMRDEQRQLLTLQVIGRDGTAHPARSLSDGTLRFLALAVLALDSESGGVICLEEPENGIHPERIPAMIQLLQALATDSNESDPKLLATPLRQVIINTHSPSVVLQVPNDSLVLAAPLSIKANEHFIRSVQLRSLRGTWREKLEGSRPIEKGQLLAYLNPVALGGDEPEDEPRPRRVIDSIDFLQYKIPFAEFSS